MSIQQKIKQVVIWGHKLHSHTHSYIHGSFFKAFNNAGYKTLWLDSNDDISNINFENTLFLTEGQVDNNIPIRNDCYYILHNCNGDKYSSIIKKNIIYLQVYTHDVINKHGGKSIENHDGCYFIEDCLFIPWATDLFPEEIDINIQKVRNNEINSNANELNFVGFMTQEWENVRVFCNNHNIKYTQVGGFSRNNIDYKENMELIQRSVIAPAIQTSWQVENGYIPCRIFKNISYGKMGLTNNPTVYELFNKQIIYNDDINQLLLDGLNFEKKTPNEKNNIIIKNMEYVRDKHTYKNRIDVIFWFLNKTQT